MKNYFNLKKSKLLLLTFLTLTVGTSPVWADELTVNDGTGTSNYVPIYGYYVDTQNTTSEFIIPADRLEDLEGGTISQMTFYLSTPVSDSWENVVFEVYLKEVTATTYASETANTEGTNTVVYTGSLDGSKSTMVVPFSSNYVYGGGNLLVGFKVTTKGYYANTYFYGETFSYGTYPAFHSDGDSHNGRDNFLPKVTFEYTAGVGVMKKPKDVTASNISMNSATISWTAGGSETSWEVSYSTSADEPAAEGSYTTVNTNSYELTGLTAGTTYYVYVRSVDGDYVTKWSIIVSFTTLEKYPIPTDVAAALTLGDGTIATLSWTENGTATQWQICLNDDEENLITTDENPFNLTGLTPETTYTAKVRAVVGEEWSKWSDAVSFTPSNAYSVTINEGTTTNEYVPIYGYYVDAMTKSQFVIPASSLQDMQWGNITKMTFYSQESSINWGNAQFEVYMTEQDGATLSSMTDYATTMTKVKSAGSLSVSDGKMVVTLDEPYLYRGDDLVIGFLQTVKGTYVRSHWYGVTADGASFGGYGSSVSQKSFLPKTTFDYWPGENLTLAEDADNSTVLTENDGKTTNVTLTRTLQTGGWNTFCVPFATAIPDGWTVKKLTGTTYDAGTLTLTFGDAENGIEAGKPYLVQVGDANVVNPAFSGVTIVDGTTETVTDYANFVPVMKPTELTGGDKSVLFVTGGNTLTYPAASGNINGFRAYFQLKGEVASLARAFRMSFDDDVTGIVTVLSDEPTTGSSTYTLDGRRIEGQPTQKGVYIVNGKKTIIK